MLFIGNIQQRQIVSPQNSPWANLRAAMKSFSLDDRRSLLWIDQIGIGGMIDSCLQNRHLALVPKVCFIIIQHWLCDLQLSF